jgi:hypothetical protein
MTPDHGFLSDTVHFLWTTVRAREVGRDVPTQQYDVLCAAIDFDSRSRLYFDTVCVRLHS